MAFSDSKSSHCISGDLDFDWKQLFKFKVDSLTRVLVPKLMSSENKKPWQSNFEGMIEYLRHANIEDFQLRFKNLLDDPTVSPKEANIFLKNLNAIKLECQKIYLNLNALQIKGEEQNALQLDVEYLLKLFTNLVTVQSEQYPKSISELLFLVLNLSSELQGISYLLPKTFSNIYFICKIPF